MEGVHPLLGIRYESVGDWTTPVLPVTKQPNVWEKMFLRFPTQLENHSRVHMPTMEEYILFSPIWVENDPIAGRDSGQALSQA